MDLNWGRKDGKVLRDVVIQGNFEVSRLVSHGGSRPCISLIPWDSALLTVEYSTLTSDLPGGVSRTRLIRDASSLSLQHYRRDYLVIFEDLEAEIACTLFHSNRLSLR